MVQYSIELHLNLVDEKCVTVSNVELIDIAKKELPIWRHAICDPHCRGCSCNNTVLIRTSLIPVADDTAQHC